MIEPRMWKAVLSGALGVFLMTSMLPGISGQLSYDHWMELAPQNPHQPVSGDSVICGYVDDNVTGDPIENASVHLSWIDAQGNNGWNITMTDASGFYEFHMGAVNFRLYFIAENYFPKSSDWLTVTDNQTYWFNVSLFPVPETILFCGFIMDNASGEPLEDTYIWVYWSDTQGHSWVNTTMSNSSGYYAVGSYMGTNQIHVDHDGYFTYSTTIEAENISVIWLNVSLVPYPSISAFVCGYIIDADLGIPVTDAQVSLFCDTGHGAFYNMTSSDARGFYRVGTITGSINLYVTKSEYSPLWEQDENITENQTLWINLTMTFNPQMTSAVQGYVTDSQTHAAVRNAFVQLDWMDHLGHLYTEKGFTDQTGFYQIAAPKGTIQLAFSATGYRSQQTALWGLRDSSDLWINASLSPEITLVFDSPQPGVYRNNTVRFPALTKILSRFFPKATSVIIGSLEIVVNITKSTQGCNRVAFYIDGEYRGVDTVAPFTYYWNDTGGLRHVIRVVAYDNAGPCRIETKTVWKIG